MGILCGGMLLGSLLCPVRARGERPLVRIDQRAVWPEGELKEGTLLVELWGLQGLSERAASSVEEIHEEGRSPEAESFWGHGEADFWAGEPQVDEDAASEEVRLAAWVEETGAPQELLWEDPSEDGERLESSLWEDQGGEPQELLAESPSVGFESSESSLWEGRPEEPEAFEEAGWAAQPKGTVTFGETNPQREKHWILTVYLSEYVVLGGDRSGLPSGCMITETPVYDREGREVFLTRLSFPIPKGAYDSWSVSIPIALREEYKSQEMAASYPLTQDAPLHTDLWGGTSPGGAGVFLWEEGAGQALAAASSPSVLVTVPPGKRDFTLSLTQDGEKAKAGDRLSYQVELANTGDLPIRDLTLTAEVPGRELVFYWGEQEGFETEGGALPLLEAGERRTLVLLVETEESVEGMIAPRVTAQTLAGDQTLSRQADIQTELLPLRAAFTVEKTADRETAGPGDVIRYQICIRNTGERTLHSVVSTERFYSADIRAQFLEMEGVRLNATKTQAYIEEIRPRESVGLEAVVELPGELEDDSLVNEVIVVTEETGEESLRSSASVRVQPRATEAPIPMAVREEGPPSEKLELAKTAPKTGDPHHKDLFEAMMLLSFILSGVSAVRLVHKNRKG